MKPTNGEKEEIDSIRNQQIDAIKMNVSRPFPVKPQPTKGDLEKAKGVYNLLFRDTSYTNNWVDEDNINEIAQALAEARAEAVKEALEHCHGVVMDLNKSELQSEYEKGQLHGAIACENGIYFMLKELNHSLTGEDK